MSGDVLVLDTVVFTDFAIPDDVSGGTSQTLAVHKLLGGDRVVDSMGQDPDDLSWAGRFRGPLADLNAQSLDALAASGNEVGCSWGTRFYTVKVKNFKWKYMAYFEVSYNIQIVVVDDGSLSSAPTSSLDTIIGLDLSTALNFGVFT